MSITVIGLIMSMVACLGIGFVIKDMPWRFVFSVVSLLVANNIGVFIWAGGAS